MAASPRSAPEGRPAAAGTLAPMRIRTLAVAGLTAVLVTACGGGDSGNGEAAKKGPQVAADAANALEQSGAAHLTGHVTEQGQSGTVDLHLQGADVSGSLAVAGQTVQLISTGGKIYAKAPAAFWSSFGAPESIAGQLDGQWVTIPEAAASSFDTFTLTGLADQLRKPSDGTYQDGVHLDKLAEQGVVVVTQTNGSTLDVAATGTPYPLKADNKGSDSPGTLTLSDFGRKTTITAPANPLDLSRLGG
jgi:hypothetical protein